MPHIFPPAEPSIPFSGKAVRLEPAGESHREQIRSLAKDPLIWEFTKTLIIDDSYDRQFDRYFDDALQLSSIGEQAFVIRTVKDNTIIGMTRIFQVDWKFRRLEIGHTWYTPSAWGTVCNKECKLLLLQYIFEQLKFLRVQFSVAHQNFRSQKAVEKIGGLKEGILRKHAIRNDGSRRDTVLFSIIDDEWPEKKERLLELVQG